MNEYERIKIKVKVNESKWKKRISTVALKLSSDF